METSIASILFYVFVGLIALEVLWAFLSKKNSYNLKDSLTNLFIIAIGKLIKPLSLLWALWLFEWAEIYRIYELPTNELVLCLTFLMVELVYYWYHRLSHEIPFLWSIHHTHHSSMWFNLTAAGRLNWFGKFISMLFYVPLVLLGFDPVLISLSLAISLFYQFLLHTEAIGKLGVLEGIFLNTPSAHRVHHGSNPDYLDKNYGGMLILWDRIFDTYVPETEKVNYGVTTGFIGHNPLIIVFKPMVDYLKRTWQVFETDTITKTKK
ncbi:sterol desaturase family protein [Sediminicola luteus]|uniref:Fatty acid hydroxylase domain-containing protein n=1 Tax=Sediminicola luteus TaxID=319238 RepID=A0A2A4G7J1_9FLAO|nr:sterol desaturase family protein [Sediminicola luteus]PCE63715.1 hypothetical protein B7P33_10590 [Sediminicola luteus]